MLIASTRGLPAPPLYLAKMALTLRVVEEVEGGGAALPISTSSAAAAFDADPEEEEED